MIDADASGTTTEHLNRLLYELLDAHVDTITLGAGLRAHIDRTVAACAVMIVVIGRNWLYVADASGRRLDPSQGLRANGGGSRAA